MDDGGGDGGALVTLARRCVGGKGERVARPPGRAVRVPRCPLGAGGAHRLLQCFGWVYCLSASEKTENSRVNERAANEGTGVTKSCNLRD